MRRLIGPWKLGTRELREGKKERWSSNTLLMLYRYGWAVSKFTFSLQEWSESKEVTDAWEELKEKHGLVLDPFKDRAQVFGMSDSAILGGWPLSLSMRKARKFGFHGSVDSYESAFEALRALARMKVVAPIASVDFSQVV